MAVHVMDALFICGTDLRQLHYSERYISHAAVLQPFSVYFCRLLLHSMTARHASMYIVTIS